MNNWILLTAVLLIGYLLLNQMQNSQEMQTEALIAAQAEADEDSDLSEGQIDDEIESYLYNDIYPYWDYYSGYNGYNGYYNSYLYPYDDYYYSTIYNIMDPRYYSRRYGRRRRPGMRDRKLMRNRMNRVLKNPKSRRGFRRFLKKYTGNRRPASGPRSPVGRRPSMGSNRGFSRGFRRSSMGSNRGFSRGFRRSSMGSRGPSRGSRGPSMGSRSMGSRGSRGSWGSRGSSRVSRGRR